MPDELKDKNTKPAEQEMLKQEDTDEPEENGVRGHIIEHLSELRKRIFISIITVIGILGICMWQAPRIVDWLRAPMDKINKQLVESRIENAEGEDAVAAKELKELSLKAIRPIEVFMSVLKMSFFLALFLSLPIVLYQIWAFISPGLRDNERSAFLPTLFFCPFMFMGGVSFGYYLVLEFALTFFVEFSASFGVEPMWSFDAYLSFVSWFLIGFGAVFEMPLVIIALAKMGLVTHGFLNRNRRYAIVAIFALAAIVTPTTDPWTMTLMALPMWALYEISVIWVYFAHKKRRQLEE